jgi:cysteinyl-tRNA synthetase
MSRKYLGETFDIHGGGKDLIFPHHENEIAQSEGANGKPFVNCWIHHGFVTIRDEKMSKSLGNFLTIRDILNHYHPEMLRFFIFSSHYRNPLDFSESAMQDAAAGLERLYACVAQVEGLAGRAREEGEGRIARKDIDALESVETRFQQAMDNDFNTAQAQAVLFDMVKVVNRLVKDLPETPAAADLDILAGSIRTLKSLAAIMGLLREDAAAYVRGQKEKMLAGLSIDEAAIQTLIKERYASRAAKNWARSDEIREELLAQGIELKDGPDGTTWSVKRT